MQTSLIPPPVVVRLPLAAAESLALSQALVLEEVPETRGSRWCMFPPWLVSLVLHLNVMILLGLWVGTGDLATRVGEVELGWSDGSGGELMTSLDSSASEAEMLLAATDIVELSPLTPTRSEKAKPEIAMQLVPAAKAGGDSAGNSSDASDTVGQGGDRAAADTGDDGNATRTSIFGIESEGKRFVYVFDRSASMNSGFLATTEGKQPVRFIIFEAAKQELTSSLDKLSRHHQFHLIFYNQDTRMFQGSRSSRRLFPANDKMKYQVNTFLYQLTAEGETYHLPALEQALRLRPDVIFLLTDGEAKDDPSAEDVQDLTQMNGGKTKINVIQICREPRIDSTLIQLAKENGGQHTFLDLLQLYELMKAQEKAAKRVGKG